MIELALSRIEVSALKKRLLLGVKQEGTCLVWTKATDEYGYGIIYVRRQRLLVHRLSWRLFKGKWPEKLVCHKCDNPPCILGAHLFQGTHKENSQDMARKGRNPGFSVAARNARRLVSVSNKCKIDCICKKHRSTKSSDSRLNIGR